jgi:hypothetical protein
VVIKYYKSTYGIGYKSDILWRFFIIKKNNYSSLLNETVNENEKKGLEKLFTMLLSIRQQILLRRQNYQTKKRT